MELRAKGNNELTDILMGATNRLMAFDYRDTFVSAFEVSSYCKSLQTQASTRQGKLRDAGISS